MTSIRDDRTQIVETVITEDDLRNTNDAEPPSIEGYVHPASYNNTIMTAFNRAKKASVAQNERSRRIVQVQRNTQKSIDDGRLVADKQTTIFDFQGA